MTSLRSLALYLTESCNLACSYCFAANMERRPIDETLARNAIDRLLFRPSNAAREVSITFWGGEPLLAFELMQSLVLYAERRAVDSGRQIRFAFPTNLTLLSESMLDFLLEHQVGMSLSLDGDAPAQALRPLRGGQSSFPIVLDKLEMLQRRLGKSLPGVRMTVSPSTAADLAHNAGFFLDRGFRNVYFAPVAEAPWSQDQLASYERQQQQLAERWTAALRSGRPWFSTSWNKAIARREMRSQGAATTDHAVVCGAGTTMLAVDIYGDIFPCHRFVFYDKGERSHSLGNVRDLADGAPLPQLHVDSSRVRVLPGDDRPVHPSAYQQLCPALNRAMCGDVHCVHPRLGALASIDERVIDQVQQQVGHEPAYKSFVEKFVAPSYRWGELSSSTILLLSRITAASPDSLTDKAEAILHRLQRQRRDPEQP